MSEMKPPTTQAEATEMIAPLDPRPTNQFTLLEKYLAYERLQEFIKLLLPE
jgi:hypothetical protein